MSPKDLQAAALDFLQAWKLPAEVLLVPLPYIDILIYIYICIYIYIAILYQNSIEK